MSATPTDFARALWEDPEILKQSTAGSCLKRIGEPDDVAYCVLYLASDESKFVTGSEFKIDGGLLAQ